MKRGLVGRTAVQFENSQTFRRNVLPQFSGSKDKIRKKLAEASKLSLLHASTTLLLVLVFGPEDGGNVFLRNVGLSPNYTTLYLRSPYFLHIKCLKIIEHGLRVA
jgi:hypothetical protein